MTEHSMSADKRSAATDAGAPSAYHRAIRILHWTMAAGFALMWLTGVLVTNVEGEPLFVADDRQGVIRDLHKSIGLTLLALLVLRLALRFILPPPPLPAAIPPRERRLAHAGHAAVYAGIVIACVTGYAIADLHDYGNAYFGVALPQMFPTSESVAGWAATPWAYLLHAVLAYGLLLLVAGHVLAVALHRRLHGVDLLPRVWRGASADPGRAYRRLGLAAAMVVAATIGFAIRGFVTLGPLEEPRDYLTTTPFHRPTTGGR